MMKNNYYAQKLFSEKLYLVYQTQLDRVKQYLEAEIRFICRQLQGREKILELGAGYGRIMKELAPFADSLVGVDISEETIQFGKKYLKDVPNCRLLMMDAHDLQFEPQFDVVICLQNGLSAIKGSAKNLIKEGLKVLNPGGKAYFSSYSSKFWEHRLAWFYEQADQGLLEEIDEDKTKNGVIVCKDGFTATTYLEEDMVNLGLSTGYPYQVKEIDSSSLFLVIEKKQT